MRALTHAHRITDTTLAADDAVVLDRGREHRACWRRCPATTRRPARLPGPADRARRQQRRGHLGLERGRRDLHDQPLALRAVVRARGPTIGTSATVARVGDQVYATAPGEAFPEVTSAIQRIVRRVRRHPRRAHHRPRRRPARLLLGPARGRLPDRPARAERLRAVQRRARTSRRTTSTRCAPPARRSGSIADGAERVRADRQPERVLRADDPVLLEPGRDRRSGGELLRHGQEGAGRRLAVDVDRLDRRHPGRRQDRLGLRRRHRRDAAEPDALHAHVPGPGHVPRAGERHRQPRQDVPLGPDGADRLAADRGRRPAHEDGKHVLTARADRRPALRRRSPPTGRSRTARPPTARRSPRPPGADDATGDDRRRRRQHGDHDGLDRVGRSSPQHARGGVQAVATAAAVARAARAPSSPGPRDRRGPAR